MPVFHRHSVGIGLTHALKMGQNIWKLGLFQSVRTWAPFRATLHLSFWSLQADSPNFVENSDTGAAAPVFAHQSRGSDASAAEAAARPEHACPDLCAGIDNLGCKQLLSLRFGGILWDICVIFQPWEFGQEVTRERTCPLFILTRRP